VEPLDPLNVTVFEDANVPELTVRSPETLMAEEAVAVDDPE